MTMRAPVPWPADPLPSLEPGSAQVFAAGLAGDPDRSVLSAEERARAARLAEDRLGRRWSRARAALRRILAAYAGADPAAVRIEQAPCLRCGEPHGKPYLAWPELDWLRFNVSHSADLALVAIAREREVGVDVEALREGRRIEGIAERSFTAAEADHLRSVAAAERERAFYRLWARKEACLKATARGLGGALTELDTLALERSGGWEIEDLDVGDGYAAALALAPPGYSPGG
jgi:4'-phosphopantetheinyl transferase